MLTRAELLAGLFAATTYLYVSFVGRFMVAEFLAIGALIVFGWSKTVRQFVWLRLLLVGYGIFLVGLVISDFYNQTPPNDFLRGWAAIIVGAASAVFLAGELAKSIRAVFIFLSVSVIAAAVLNEGSLDTTALSENSNAFKVFFVPVLLPAVALISCLLWKSNRLFSVMFVFISGIGFVAFDARSSGGALCLASLLMLAKLSRRRLKFSDAVFLVLILSAASYGAYAYYVDQVLNHGLGGANAMQLMAAENPYNPIDLLAVGRSETRVAFEAISEKPILGFGSWAKDPDGYFAMLQGSMTGQFNYVEHSLGIIPAHSMWLGAWLWAGLFGFVGMGIVGFSIFRMFLAAFQNSSILMPAVCIFFVAAVWAFLFSPLGHIRTSFPFTIALLLAASTVEKQMPITRAGKKRS